MASQREAPLYSRSKGKHKKGLYSLKAKSSMKDTAIMLLATFSGWIVGWIQLRQQNLEATLFQTHPKTMSVAVYSLVVTWFLYGFKLRFPTLYEAYLVTVPVGVDFFGSLSMVSALSFLLSDTVRPLLYFLDLLMPAANIISLIFQKLEARFGETEFWIRNVHPVLLKLKRMVNRARRMRPILPL
ncbi:uncharacterized protein LOC132042261 [Lycium ferocissimum]|uniref:uncharacterized protein LOC132042261 n=1 Tax=Lycium ferocissimum TaxID=112874 RepID=UPI002816876E|nr:uncharacterized protein LOC132042261 [Lycium ferocissimum]